MAKSGSFCEPCFRGELESKGFSYCSDCEEVLCQVCDKAHRVGKLTLKHHTTELEQVPKIPEQTINTLGICDKHPENCVELYCNFHNTLCCKNCMVEDHRSCDKLDVIDDIADNIKSSALVEDISKAITALLQTYETIIENRVNIKDTIIQRKTYVIKSITKLKEDLTGQIDLLEKSLLAEMEKQQKKILLQIETETTNAMEAQKNMNLIKEEFDFNLNYGSNKKLFILSEKLKSSLSLEEDRIKGILSEMKNISVDFTEQENIPEIISSLACIKLGQPHCGIEHAYALQKAAQFVYPLLSLIPIQSFNISLSSEKSITGITCIEITEEGRLLLYHCYGKEVLMYEEDGTFIRKSNLESRPYQICLISNKSEAVLTMPDIKVLLSIDTDTLKTVRSLHTGREYWGIQYFHGTLVVGGSGSIDMISMDGTVNRSICFPDKRLVRYIIKGVDNSLIFTQSSKLIYLNLTDETQVFENKTFSEARGIAVDKNGYIYVADKTAKKIHRLCQDGTNKDIICDDVSPLAIRFSRDFSRLYIGLENEKRLAVFGCK